MLIIYFYLLSSYATLSTHSNCICIGCIDADFRNKTSSWSTRRDLQDTHRSADRRTKHAIDPVQLSENVCTRSDLQRFLSSHKLRKMLRAIHYHLGQSDQLFFKVYFHKLRKKEREDACAGNSFQNVNSSLASMQISVSDEEMNNYESRYARIF